MEFKELYEVLSKSGLTIEDLATTSAERLSTVLRLPVEIVQKNESPYSSLKSEHEGWREQEEEISMILRIAGHYIKLTGTNDSYGRNIWHGFPQLVSPEEYTSVRFVPMEVEQDEKLTVEKIWATLQFSGISRKDLGKENVDWDDYIFGEVETVESWGGEGEGPKIGVVYRFVEHDLYMRIDGYYQSHHGSEWDNDPYEVRPQQVTKTVYK